MTRKKEQIGQTLLKLKGDPNQSGRMNRSKAVRAAAIFHGGAHLTQETANRNDFMAAGPETAAQVKSTLERDSLDDYIDYSLSSYGRQNETRDEARVLMKQTAGQKKYENELQSHFCKSSGIINNSNNGGEIALLEDFVVPIPRRPVNFLSGQRLSAVELAKQEEEAFVKWRVILAEIEEKRHRTVTPFERNLEFWRQLWRVLERSDIVVQIVDARNPLFFRCIDLERYVKEIHSSKETVLLLNKSDLVPQHVRQKWALFFRSRGVHCLFFSSLIGSMATSPERHPVGGDEGDQANECEAIATVPHGTQPVLPDKVVRPLRAAAAAAGRQRANRFQGLSDSETDDSSEKGNSAESASGLSDDDCKKSEKRTECQEDINKCSVKDSDDAKIESKDNKSNGGPWTAEELLEKYFVSNAFVERSDEDFSAYIERVSVSGEVLEPTDLLFVLMVLKKILIKQRLHEGQAFAMDASGTVTVGLVGYPNVGKSSMINTVLGCKAVSVGRQPGKTKHFQTLPLPTLGLTLCDCPGLVFPQIVSSKAHLVTNGVSPIDSLRDFTAPVQLICDLLPTYLPTFYNLDPNKIIKLNEQALDRKLVMRQGILTRKSQDDEAGKEITAATAAFAGNNNTNNFDGKQQVVKRLEVRKFLTALAYSRGHISSGKGGAADVFAAAKIVLRDFTTGKLPHCVLPPDT